jgi:uncharacterized membrane protein
MSAWRRRTAGASLVAVEYAREREAEHALRIVGDLADRKALVVHDAAIVVRHEDGRVELRQSRELATGEAAVGGGSIGILLGLAVAVPVAGALVGVAAGMGFSVLDRGISNDEMRHLGEVLRPGHAVLFVLARKVDWELLSAGLEPTGGTLVSSEISEQVLDGLGAALPPRPGV